MKLHLDLKKQQENKPVSLPTTGYMQDNNSSNQLSFPAETNVTSSSELTGGLVCSKCGNNKNYHYLDSVMIGDKGAATDMQELRKCESL
jgi:hypothetical protein